MVVFVLVLFTSRTSLNIQRQNKTLRGAMITGEINIFGVLSQKNATTSPNSRWYLSAKKLITTSTEVAPIAQPTHVAVRRLNLGKWPIAYCQLNQMPPASSARMIRLVCPSYALIEARDERIPSPSIIVRITPL